MVKEEAAAQEEPPNTCCAALKKKHTKLVEKHSKLEQVKNQFRDLCTTITKKFNVIERENESLKQEMEKLKLQADTWKDEKEQESARRVDLEDEVSALKEEIQSLKQSGKSVSQEANEQLQERVNVAEKEISRLKELLEKETRNAALEKKNAELQKKKFDEALKKVQMEKKKASEEALKVVNGQNGKSVSQEANEQLQERVKVAEKEISRLKELLEKETQTAALEKKNAELQRKKNDEDLKKVQMEKNKACEALKVANEQKDNSVSQKANEQLQERVNVAEKEINRLKELLEKETRTVASEKKNADLQRKKVDETLKKLQVEKNKACEAQKVANMERKKTEENRLLWEKLKTETDALKSTLALERSKSEGVDKKVEEEKQKTIKERKRANSAVAKAEEQRKLAETNFKKAVVEKDRADDLNKKLEVMRSRAENLEAELRKQKLCSDGGMGMVKSDVLMPQQMPLVEEQNIIKEKNRSDTERKKAKEQKKAAKMHKKMATIEKHRADQLSTELKSYKLRLQELEKKLQESVPQRMQANSSPPRYDNVISETDTVRLLKKQLKLEKMLVKHAKKATKMESTRNDMLHQELVHLKHVFHRLQQHLDMLDDSFLHGDEGTHRLEKVGKLTSTRETIFSDEYHKQFISGIDSGLDPPYRGSNRKMLQSSAINSSSASFSDRHLVGSQERGVISVMTSAKLGEDVSNLKRTMSMLSDKPRIRTHEHAVDRSDNSTGSPLRGNVKERRLGYCDKNMILDVVESIENLYSEGQKLHRRVSEKLSLLHGVLDDQKDEPAEENPCRENARPFKRRKTSREGSIVIHPFHDSDEQNTMPGLDIHQSDAIMRASPPGLNVTKSGQCFQDGTDSISEDRCNPQDVFEMASCDYMKLLDLNNTADEELYRIAIAMPLSPTLPEIEFQVDDNVELEDPEVWVDKNSKERLSTVKDYVAPTHILDISKNPSNLKSNDTVSSQLQTKESSIDCNNPLQSIDARFQQIQVSGGELELTDIPHAGNEEINILYESRIAASTPGGTLKCLVLLSDNKDNDSILRILQTMGNCMPQCALINSTEIFLRSLLPPLLKAEDISMKEKVCVFFSIMLHGILEGETKSLTNVVSDDLVQSLGSLTLHIHSAFSDLDLRRIFMESCDLVELLALIEDFLLQRKVLVHGDVSPDSQVLCGSKVNVVLDGKSIKLSEVVASGQLLVAGGVLLASLCLAVDHIGFVCEMSCNIFRMQKFEPSAVLAVLHAFAHICGSKYLTLQQYAVPMTVVKSLVMFLEKQTMATNSTSSSHSITPCTGWLCSNTCPFSDGAVSMEDVAVLLLEKLQMYGQSVSWPKDSLELMNSLIPRVLSCEDGIEEDSSLKEAVPSSDTSDENLCGIMDILSLVEILASFMSWDWTFDNIIGQFCEWLESRLMEGFSAVIVVLLGQLGRLGVGASGYEDTRVEKLRKWLCSHLCQDTFGALIPPVQLGIINALLSLVSIKFEEVIQDGAETSAIISQFFPADSIREWFSRLSPEQQSAFRLSQGCW